MQSDLCILLIDMQAHSVTKMALSEQTALVREQLKVLDVCSRYDIPAVTLELHEDGWLPTVRTLRRACDAIPRHATVPKYRASSFSALEFLKQIERWRIGHLIVMGINTSFCVLSTILDARKRTYGVSTAYNLIADTGDGGPALTGRSLSLIDRSSQLFDDAEAMLKFHGIKPNTLPS